MDKTVIFMSQPIENMNWWNINTRRTAAVDALKEYFKGRGRELIFSDEAEEDGRPADIPNENIWRLAKKLFMMAKCDYICMCPEWEFSRQCRIEHAIAKHYAANIIYLDADYGVHWVEPKTMDDERDPDNNENILMELRELNSTAKEIKKSLAKEETPATAISLGDIQRYERYRENYIAKRKLVEETENERKN